jgi:hypothetical protein
MHSIRTSQFGLGYRRSIDAAVQGTPFRYLLADGDAPPPPPADKTYTQAELDAHVAGLKTKNTELLGKLANSKIKDLPDDATPEEIAEAVKEQRKAKTKKLEDEGNYQALLASMGEKHTSEKKGLEEKIATLSSRIVTREKKISAGDAIREMEGKAKWLLPEILPQLAVEVSDDSDEYTVFVVDKKGNAVMNSNGTRKTAKDLLAEMREQDEWKDAFLAPDVAGGGARGGAGRQSANGDVILVGAEAKDPQKYRAAKALAEKNGGKVVIR